MKYAILNLDNIVVNVVLADKPSNDKWIDVTNVTVDKGWEYINNEFIEKPFINPLAIRKITKRAFMKRIDQLDRIAIRKSTDDIVIDIHEDLKMASSVDLDDKDVTDSIAYLTSKNLLDNTDMTALVADGTQDESI